MYKIKMQNERGGTRYSGFGFDSCTGGFESCSSDGKKCWRGKEVKIFLVEYANYMVNSAGQRQ